MGGGAWEPAGPTYWREHFVIGRTKVSKATGRHCTLFSFVFVLFVFLFIWRGGGDFTFTILYESCIWNVREALTVRSILLNNIFFGFLSMSFNIVNLCGMTMFQKLCLWEIWHQIKGNSTLVYPQVGPNYTTLIFNIEWLKGHSMGYHNKPQTEETLSDAFVLYYGGLHCQGVSL